MWYREIADPSAVDGLGGSDASFPGGGEWAGKPRRLCLPIGKAGAGERRLIGAAEGIALEDFNEVEILLVEDNPYDAELTLRALKNKGLANKLLTFADGVEALDFLFGAGVYAGRNLAMRPKVILLDLKLPRINGLEILEKIRTDARTKSIPVVILTSSQEESDIVRGYHLGVNSYMVKPVDFDKFFQVVEGLGLYWLLLNKVPN
jgi:two-component system, response regulator